ncbi:preprotein translocase subunit SecY [Buchnera aphidicola]|uniref:preprotein translocase subunit SecY n=1 Tax=Buchnera aphidicola TaxID=9 RepID=UPI00209276F8|nr:preprotein translocase subunit SecY [Buchnera aphidicola]USS94066.1 preprotein translocase subunit SecY [Buchnera aphidicola (Sipha maydis)]WII23611.1 preprotein translocase subunit SecY [Buchnera aphidicola (Sipha maydis)]
MEKFNLGLNYQDIRVNFSDIQKRVLFLIFALIIFRLGSFIPIPGIDIFALSKLLNHQEGTLVEMLNIFSGGALSRASIFSLGIMPYISSSIIVQLLTFIYPSWKNLKKEGEVGRIKINQYTKNLTLVIAIIQASGISLSLSNIPGIRRLIFKLDAVFYITAIISLVTGTIFLIWLGDLITENGIGNGISVMIFAGIVSHLPVVISHTISELKLGHFHFMLFILSLLFIFLIIFFVVFIEKSQRKIPIYYSNQQQRYKMHLTQVSHLPLKINMSGVIPAIFASSIILFPLTIISWLRDYHKNSLNFFNILFDNFQPGKSIYIIFYAISIIFFCFFYTNLAFNARETSENLKKSGAFIQGIRPGKNTSEYIQKIMFKLTFVNSIYIVLICLIPEFMRQVMHTPFYFGGTSLLIVVVVIIDLILHIQTLLLSKQYKSSFKRANLNL